MCRSKEEKYLKGEQFPFFLCSTHAHWDTLSLVRAPSLFHWVRLRRRRSRERDCHMAGYKDGRLYNGGLIFHKVVSHHQEKEISEIKNEISSAHWQKPCRLWTSSVLPLANLIGRQHDSELHICILQTSAFTRGSVETKPPTQTTHTHTPALMLLYLHHTQTVTMVKPEPDED